MSIVLKSMLMLRDTNGKCTVYSREYDRSLLIENLPEYLQLSGLPMSHHIRGRTRSIVRIFQTEFRSALLNSPSECL